MESDRDPVTVAVTVMTSFKVGVTVSAGDTCRARRQADYS